MLTSRASARRADLQRIEHEVDAVEAKLEALSEQAADAQDKLFTAEQALQDAHATATGGANFTAGEFNDLFRHASAQCLRNHAMISAGSSGAIAAVQVKV